MPDATREVAGVTAIVVMRDHARFLDDCLTSIKREFGCGLPVILVDTGSSDQSVSVALEVSRREKMNVHLLQCERGHTTLDAIRLAGDFIETDYIFGLSADDALGTGYRVGVESAIALGISSVTFFNLTVTDNELNPLRPRSPRWSSSRAENRRKLLRGNPGTAPGALLPWSAVSGRDLVAKAPKILIEDYWLWWMLVERVDFRVSTQGEVLYRQHSGNLTAMHTDAAYARSLGYCVGLARTKARSPREVAWTYALEIRWRRRIRVSCWGHFSRGIREAEANS